MADNVTIPATGTGTATPSVATDDVGGQHYQRVKISDGVADSSTHLAIVAEDAALAGGETGIIAMGQRKDSPTSTAGTDGDATHALFGASGAQWVSPLLLPVTLKLDVTRPADTTTYAAGDCLSDSTSAPTSGGFTFTNAARKSGGSGLIVGANFATSNDPGTRLSGELWLFDTSVTNINDNTAFAVSDTEIKTCIGVIPFNMFDAGNNGYCNVEGLNMMFTCSDSANLRALFRVRNAYIPASAEVISAMLKIIQLD